MIRGKLDRRIVPNSRVWKSGRLFSMTKRTGRPVGRPKLYAKRVKIGFTAEHLQALEELQDRDGLTFNDAVRNCLDKALERDCVA